MSLNPILIFKKGVTADIVYHEVLHAVINIAEQKGIILSDDSEEFYTYTMAYLGGEICRWLKLHKKVTPDNTNSLQK